MHSVSQDYGFSLEDPLHETHYIGEHLALVGVRYCFGILHGLLHINCGE